MASPKAYGITEGVFSCGLIPYDCFAINSIPQRVADSIPSCDGFHTSLRDDSIHAYRRDLERVSLCSGKIIHHDYRDVERCGEDRSQEHGANREIFAKSPRQRLEIERRKR